MARRVEPLTGDTVEEFPEPCRSCLFWELGAPCPDRVSAPMPSGLILRDKTATDALVRKQAWVSARVQEGTPPGRVVRVDGEVAAHAVYAPARAFARRLPPVPAASKDAVQLATVWVQPDRRSHGLGGLLLRSALRDALRARAAAVEAYGDRRWRERSCLLPATWLLHSGFVIHREHPRTPLLRLELRRTVRWTESLEHAWEEVLERLPRRAPVPMPDGPARPPTPRSARHEGPHRSG